MEKKIVENIIGKHQEGIVEKTTKKTLQGNKQATTSEGIVKNII